MNKVTTWKGSILPEVGSVPIWVLERRVVNVIEQRTNSRKFSFEKGFTGSKGRCPFEFSNVHIVIVIEHRDDSGRSVLEKSLKEIEYRK